MKPSSAPPPSSFGVKPSAAPLCDRSEVEHEPSVKVVEGEVDAIPESPVESIADIPEEGGSLVEVHSSEDDGEEAARSLNRSLTHCPKSRHCEICQIAKMTSRYHRRRGDPNEDETPPLHFGHQMRVAI